jgi:Protein of unknown function (DUF1570)
MRWLGRGLIALALACGGCVGWRSAHPELPARDNVRLDQLVIHSNFEIPSQHRLLQEVNALRLDVSGKLGLPTSDEPIHVYLFEDGERFGAFIHSRFPQFPDRRAFFVETDTRLAVYAQWGEHVAVDLRHEVTHGYLHSMLPNLPLWLDEGLAEYFETPRGQHGYHRVNIDDLVAGTAAGRWYPNIHRLEALKSVAEMSRTEYAESWAWVHLLLETDPARQELLHNYLIRLRRDAVIEPLSSPLRQAGLDDPQLLLNHVRELAARPVN